MLVESLRKGYWIILDELNLAPSEVNPALVCYRYCCLLLLLFAIALVVCYGSCCLLCLLLFAIVSGCGRCTCALGSSFLERSSNPKSWLDEFRRSLGSLFLLFPSVVVQQVGSREGIIVCLSGLERKGGISSHPFQALSREWPIFLAPVTTSAISPSALKYLLVVFSGS